MKLIAETIYRIAPTDVPVLIVGASGVGKELVAKAIHLDSQRESDSFVAINFIANSRPFTGSIRQKSTNPF